MKSGLTIRSSGGEDVALAKLKEELRFPSDEIEDFVNSSNPDKGADPLHGFPIVAINSYLLRFLRVKRLSVDEALAKMKRRRVFEYALPTISVTPVVLDTLRCGALHIVGPDITGRPVLYLNLAALTVPHLAMEDVRRLLVMLLEYMQVQCIATSTPEGQAALRNRTVPATSGGAAHSAASTDLDATHRQEFTILINEENCTWSTHRLFMKNFSSIFTIFTKYYPRLLGLVIIVGASFEVRTGLSAALRVASDEIRGCVEMIEKADLTRYMDSAYIPAELGGAKQVLGSAVDFSEGVLRYWFTLTTELEREARAMETKRQGTQQQQPNSRIGAAHNIAEEMADVVSTPAAGGSGRPLYLPPPLLNFYTQSTIGLWRSHVELQHLCTYDHMPGLYRGAAAASRSPGAGEKPLSLSASSVMESFGDDENDAFGSRRRSLQSPDALATSQLFTAGSFGGGGGDHGADTEGTAPGPLFVTSPKLSKEEEDRIKGDPTVALAELQRERHRRFTAEQRLQFTELGVTLDPRNMSVVERELAGIHHDLNVMVAEVLVAVQGSRTHGGPTPTLNQLLDVTLTALDKVVDRTAEVPAMQLAPLSAPEESSGSSCCNVM